MRASIAACSSSSTAASAFSISVSTSPMPRIRDAIRSGWKYSSWSSFSPTETSLIGLPVTAWTESAAPPRASPSSFVSTTPSKAIRSKNASATLTASWPVMASSTSRTLVGFAASRTRASSSISVLVDVQPAGGVDDDDVVAGLAGGVEPVLDDLDRILRVAAVDGDLDLAAELLELVDRRRTLQVGCDQGGLLARPSAAAARASRRWSSCRSPGGRRAGSPSAACRTRAASRRSPSASSAPRGRSSRPAGPRRGSSARPGRSRARAPARRSP